MNLCRMSGWGSARIDLACELVDSIDPEIARLIRKGSAAARNGSTSVKLQKRGIDPDRNARHRSLAMARASTPLRTAPSGREADNTKRIQRRRGNRASSRSPR